MVGVLRADDGAELLPVPTVPDDFSAAEQQAALAGLEFYRSSAGAFPQSVSDSCVVTVHRIVQEALTNVARHAGSVRVDLHLEHGADAVTVSITNQSGQAVATERPLPTGGSGIVGMTERAESLGGSLRAEPLDDGGFRVLAEVPYRRVVS